jgi:hypothetical protein
MREHKHDLICRCPMPYALADVVAGVWGIAQDAEAILLGDESSVKVILNNMTGRNYEGRGGHRAYLAYMSRECRVTIRPDAVRLIEGGKA